MPLIPRRQSSSTRGWMALKHNFTTWQAQTMTFLYMSYFFFTQRWSRQGLKRQVDGFSEGTLNYSDKLNEIARTSWKSGVVERILANMDELRRSSINFDVAGQMSWDFDAVWASSTKFSEFLLGFRWISLKIFGLLLEFHRVPFKPDEVRCNRVQNSLDYIEVWCSSASTREFLHRWPELTILQWCSGMFSVFQCRQAKFSEHRWYLMNTYGLWDSATDLEVVEDRIISVHQQKGTEHEGNDIGGVL